MLRAIQLVMVEPGLGPSLLILNLVSFLLLVPSLRLVTWSLGRRRDSPGTAGVMKDFRQC